jgi:hypothetical protein
MNPTPDQPLHPAIVWQSAQREAQFTAWLAVQALLHDLQAATLRPASADASFRRYFRINTPTGSCIIMDAPPDKENSEPFVRVATLLKTADLLAPTVLAWDEAQGFMLLTDLGNQTMLDVLDPLDTYAHTSRSTTANLRYYEEAIDALIQWQLASKPNVLPSYEKALLMRELQLFPDWYIRQHRGLAIDNTLQAKLDAAFELITTHNLSAPSVYVHRDFMPRNLMQPYPHLLEGARPHQHLGVLDFQDAVYGPITYDIASLMRDAFLSWEEDFVMDVTIRYWQKAKAAGLPMLEEWHSDFGAFYKATEWMGLQRHLKILGIFARLTLRDGKPKYLADTPRFIGYVRATCARYIELKPLLRLIDAIENAA